MRILMVTYHFPPDGAIGAVRPYQFARLLPQYGIEPWILTVRPEYASFPDPTYQLDGVPEHRVVRTEVLPSRRDKYLRMTYWLRRLLKGARRKSTLVIGEAGTTGGVVSPSPSLWQCFVEWLSFPDWYAGWYHPAVCAANKLLKQISFAAVWSTSFPRTAQIIGYEISKRYGLPWIADWRDPWLHYIEGWGDPSCPYIRRRYEQMLVRHLEQVSLVTMNSEKLCEFWQARMPEYAAKFCPLPNGIPEELWSQSIPLVKTERFVISYLGSIYQRLSPSVVFRGLKLWMENKPEVRNHVELRFYGDMPRDNVLLQAENDGVADIVRVENRVNRGEIVELIKRSTCLLLLAQGLILKIPGKTYEYLISNKPIIAVAEPDSATGMLLRGMPGCYVVANPEDVAKAVDEVWQAYRAHGMLDTPRRKYLDAYRYSNLARDLSNLLRQLLSGEDGGV
jgi:hypothetical protein